VESAVRYLFQLREGEGQPPEVAARLAAANAELRTTVEAKASEGKKPAKGAPVPAEGAIDEAVFTFAFCQALPAELLRRCVSAQVRLQQACQRRGFVLDLWDGKTVVGAESLHEALNSIMSGTEHEGVPIGVELVAELHVSIVRYRYLSHNTAHFKPPVRCTVPQRPPCRETGRFAGRSSQGERVAGGGESTGSSGGSLHGHFNGASALKPRRCWPHGDGAARSAGDPDRGVGPQHGVPRRLRRSRNRRSGRGGAVHRRRGAAVQRRPYRLAPAALLAHPCSSLGRLRGYR
jgi:hypothetical protein